MISREVTQQINIASGSRRGSKAGTTTSKTSEVSLQTVNIPTPSSYISNKMNNNTSIMETIDNLTTTVSGLTLANKPDETQTPNPSSIPIEKEFDTLVESAGEIVSLLTRLKLSICKNATSSQIADFGTAIRRRRNDLDRLTRNLDQATSTLQDLTGIPRGCGA